MIIKDEIRKCVVFIGYKMANGEMRFAGSGFFLGRAIEGNNTYNTFLVTAKHLIDNIRNRGINEIFIRANTKDGESTWLQCKTNDWLFHPTDKTVDVAIHRAGIPQELDHYFILPSLFATEKVFADNAVGLGDEVIIVGLFRHHFGTRRNIPIVRVGNLAAIREDKVATSTGLLEAYLIEARSIGGLSGSPVFLNLGIVRYLDNEVKHAKGGSIYFLLRLIHGHYDVHVSDVDNHQLDDTNELSISHINTGMAIVIPIHKILEVVDAHSQQEA